MGKKTAGPNDGTCLDPGMFNCGCFFFYGCFIYTVYVISCSVIRIIFFLQIYFLFEGTKILLLGNIQTMKMIVKVMMIVMSLILKLKLISFMLINKYLYA
jgi:hypothetical protein